jgi:hypothetical protein
LSPAVSGNFGVHWRTNGARGEESERGSRVRLLTFASHDKATIPAGLVRKILVRDVGLAEDEARKLL